MFLKIVVSKLQVTKMGITFCVISRRWALVYDGRKDDQRRIQRAIQIDRQIHFYFGHVKCCILKIGGNKNLKNKKIKK
jgi:hypothetical protein